MAELSMNDQLIRCRRASDESNFEATLETILAGSMTSMLANSLGIKSLAM
jgi:hypothetical protein